MDYSKICKLCSQYKDCGFISRNLQNKCDIIQNNEDGYEQGYADAIDRACEWLEENTPMRFDDIKNYTKNFRKAMEGGDE